MQKEISPYYYKRIVISDVVSAIERFREILDRNSTFDEFINAQEELVSATRAVFFFGLPDSFVDFYKVKAQSLALTSLEKSVASFHAAYRNGAPNHILKAKDEEVLLAMDLTRRLGVEAVTTVKTILSVTPQAKRQRYLEIYLAAGTISEEEAAELSSQFGLSLR